MAAYYNEIDPHAAAWLRALITAGHIAPGDVDERSIVDVRADDLRWYQQCHFFAGIGVWSYALRNAGWADDRFVWSGSCPCQPFSAAGKGDEFADERHLWPAWFRLIRECRPDAIFGEQVASKDALAWLDHVSTDLEAEGYAVGAVDTCAAGFGAPHIRQRLYFVADAVRNAAREHARELHGDESEHGVGPANGDHRSRDRGTTRALADDNGQGCNRLTPPRLHERRQGSRGDESAPASADGSRGHDADGCSDVGGVADAALGGHSEHERNAGGMGGTGSRDEGKEPESRRAASAAWDSSEADGMADADAGRCAARLGCECGSGRLADACRCGVVGDTSGRGRRVVGDAALARDGGHADGAIVADIVGDTELARLEGHRRDVDHRHESGRLGADATGSTAAAGAFDGGCVADAECPQRRPNVEHVELPGGRIEATDGHSGGRPVDGTMADAECDGGRTDESQREPEGRAADGWPRATNGFWRDADWIPCRDGKARAIEPGTLPLVNGAPARVVRLRGYGNAINAEQARAFIEAYREAVE